MNWSALFIRAGIKKPVINQQSLSASYLLFSFKGNFFA